MTVDDDRDELRKVARSFLENTLPAARLRRIVASEDGSDEELWRSLTELGWHALGLDEEVGGGGGSWQDLAVVLEEMGRVLLPSPFFASTVLAAQAVAGAGTEEQQRDWLGAIGRGDLTARWRCRDETVAGMPARPASTSSVQTPGGSGALSSV
jgi:alkylation response protein AidB-like acyl-CoA dehydrogenase